MKLTVRQRTAEAPPGLRAPARVDRRTPSLLPRLRPGDIAVIDHIDLDRATAQALVEARVAAVVNAAPMISGRFPNLGPLVLAEAGIPLVDTVGSDALARLRDGVEVRLHEGELFTADGPLARGRVVDLDLVRAEMDEAREGMAAQLDTFTRNRVELVHREEDLLLHGQGLPALRTKLAGRPVVVVVRSVDHEEELTRITRFIYEQDAVLIGVQRGADALVAAGLKPHIVVLDPRDADRDQPSPKALKSARDVVVRTDAGLARATAERFEKLGVRPQVCETGAAAEDLALLLAHRGDASVIVGVGLHATLEEFLDRQRPGLASTYLTRLTVGDRLVDARSLPVLYSGRVKTWHLLLVLLVGLAAVAAAVATTPVGHQWASDLEPALRRLFHDFQGLFS